MSTLLLAVLSVAAVGTFSTSMRVLRRRQLVARRLSLLDEEAAVSLPFLEGMRSAWDEAGGQLRAWGAGLASRASRRRRAIALSVSPVVDRIVCRMASGMSFDSAVGAVVREHPAHHRVLKAELSAYLQETRLGKAPQEALVSLSRRCGTPELDRVLGAVLMGGDAWTLRARLLECALGLHARPRPAGTPWWVLAIAAGSYLPALYLVWGAH